MPSLLLLLLLLLQRAAGQCNPSGSSADTRIEIVSGSGNGGTSCFFPFEYGGAKTDCELYTNANGNVSYWCATSCNYGSDGLWRDCKFTLADLAETNCSGLTGVAASAEPSQLYGGVGAGASCHFPFLWAGVCYHDCHATAEDPWCATTDVQHEVRWSWKYCRYTRRGIAHSSCSGIAGSAPAYIHPQVGNYSHELPQTDQFGNCTFPFYHGDRCYDDCTTEGLGLPWYLPWCSTEQFYLPAKKWRVCPHYRGYRGVAGLALDWGFYRLRLHSGCGSSSPFCNASWARAAAGVPVGVFGDTRMALDSSGADVVEVMPQPNGYFVLRLPLACKTDWDAVTLDYDDVTYRSVSLEREFWDIKAASGANLFTIQSTWDTTKSMHVGRTALSPSGHQVLKLQNSSVEWRFDKLSDAELSSLGLPCEDPLTTTTSPPTTTTSSDGGWCSWSAFVVTGTTGTRTRNCSCPPPSGGACVGSGVDSGTVVNASWCSWSAFTASGAYATRLRQCNCSAAAYGGADCAGSGNDTGLTVNGGWCSWSAFTVNGAYATRLRACNCSAPAYAGADCAGSGNDTGLVVDGGWCSWSAYTVNGAYATRLRACNCPAPAYTGAGCVGSDNDTGLVVNGNWCSWSAFTVSGAYATRLRACNCSAPAYAGADCAGSGNDTGLVVDGGWCNWSGYTVAAGVGTRTRTCACPAAAYTGAACPGSSVDTLAQVNGTWCEWSGLTSGYGVLWRTRQCNCSSANVIGHDCAGASSQEFPCNVSSCQTTTAGRQDGGWCEWDAWASGGFNTGVMSRSRRCECPAASGGGADCGGSARQLAECSISGCAVVWAEPREKGDTGAAFSSSSLFNKLVIWAGVSCGLIFIAGAAGVALAVWKARE